MNQGDGKKKKDRLLLLCDQSAKIAFISGSTNIFETTHSKLLHKNFFDLGLLYHSKLSLSKQFPYGLLANHDFVNFECQINIRGITFRYPSHTNSQPEEDKTSLNHSLKNISLRCSRIRMDTKYQPLKEREIPVCGLSEYFSMIEEAPRGDCKDSLVMLEIEQVPVRNATEIDPVDLLATEAQSRLLFRNGST